MCSANIVSKHINLLGFWYSLQISYEAPCFSLPDCSVDHFIINRSNLHILSLLGGGGGGSLV